MLYQPDIPQNTGAIMRLAACFGVPLKVIEPCGFVFSDARLRRAGLDYTAKVVLTRHVSWDPYQGASERDPAVGQLVLLTTQRLDPPRRVPLFGNDRLLFGSGAAGVPGVVRHASASPIRIAMHAGTRSLNVALLAAIVISEAQRELRDGQA